MTVHTRRRRKLVEGNGVEAFEIRATLWFDEHGEAFATVDITDPDGPVSPPEYEVRGLLDMAHDLVIQEYS